MNKRAVLVLVIVGLGATAAAYWQWSRHAWTDMKMAPAEEKAPAAGSGEKKVLYWYDPMVPAQHFDKPGKSPFMDMQLVPKYADEGESGTVTIDPRVVQNLGVRTTKVERGTMAQRTVAVGAVQADERRIEVVQTRAAGWVERLNVRAVNDPVHRGQLLAEIYAPDLYAAQQEFVLAQKMARARPDDSSLLQASRARLSFLGLSESQIRRLEQSGEAQRRIAFYAPRDGIVTELGVREGMQVSPGMTLFSLVDLSRIWVNAEIPEDRAGAATPGTQAEASVTALPGQVFKGQVDYLYPEVMAETRTLKARVVLDNPKLALKPGMYASVTLLGTAHDNVTMVPTEALIRTGERTVAIVQDEAGRFRPVVVTTGMESNGKTEILSGLEEGQSVVSSGQFLIDSEASLRGALQRLEEPAVPTAGGKQ